MEELKKSFSLRKLPWGWILLGITLWFLFPWIFSVFFNLIIKNSKEYGESFGAVGDIYGSLNAFVSSIALCAVAYSTWLQVTSLKETRKMNKDQMKLTKEVHDEQMTESRNAIFATKFYSLLNFKNERLNQIKLSIYGDNREEIQVDGVVAISKMSKIFLTELHENREEIESYEKYQLLSHFRKVIPIVFIDLVNPIISYFYIYENLINLINDADISVKDREFFKSILRNSMFQEEQMVLFWIAPIFENLENALKDSELFNQFHRQRFHKYALKFHKKSHFKSEGWKKLFDTNQTEDKNKAPT